MSIALVLRLDEAREYALRCRQWCASTQAAEFAEMREAARRFRDAKLIEQLRRRIRRHRLRQDGEVTDMKEFHQDNSVDFHIKFASPISEIDVEKKLKLISSISTNNYVLFDKNQ